MRYGICQKLCKSTRLAYNSYGTACVLGCIYAHVGLCISLPFSLHHSWHSSFKTIAGRLSEGEEVL